MRDLAANLVLTTSHQANLNCSFVFNSTQNPRSMSTRHTAISAVRDPVIRRGKLFAKNSAATIRGEEFETGEAVVVYAGRYFGIFSIEKFAETLGRKRGYALVHF